MEYEDLPEVVNQLKRLEKPLVAYLFSTDKSNIKLVEREISAGTFSVNDTIMFVGIPQLPFGGVGNSGQGRSFVSSDILFNHKYIQIASAESAIRVYWLPFLDIFRYFIFIL